MIRNIIALTGLFLLSIATPAFAHNPEYAKTCTKESENFTNAHAKSAFLKSCLKQIDMTAFQMEEKAEQCDQNAKNMKLEGERKDAYLEHCYLKDDTHPNPNQKPYPKK